MAKYNKSSMSRARIVASEVASQSSQVSDMTKGFVVSSSPMTNLESIDKVNTH